MKALQTLHDEETDLIKAAQRGDLDAFNALILRYQNLLFGIALRMLNDEDIASDAVQEALISAFNKFRTGDFHRRKVSSSKFQVSSSKLNDFI